MPQSPDDHVATPVCAFVQRTITAALNRVRVARWIGEQAVTYGYREMAKAFAAGATTAAPSPDVVVEGGEPVDVIVAAPIVVHTAPPAVVASGAGTAAPTGEAPFEGYDTLPAAYIVQRLVRLAPGELAALRAYELGHRGRRTVVAKVDQLLDG